VVGTLQEQLCVREGAGIAQSVQYPAAGWTTICTRSVFASMKPRAQICSGVNAVGEASHVL
jgi:hypothetical protein